MLSFENDYNVGAHPQILARLCETNFEPMPGYGSDGYTASAIEKIRKACRSEDADVHLIVGGTQTNRLVISAMLRAYEGVISASTGHINAHEGGAIESSGHKVLSLSEHMGKLSPAEVEGYLADFYADRNHDHMVFPGMVYISHPTEYGTLYTKAELTALSEICRRYGIPLFLDGARLGYGLMSRETDLTLPDIAALCDVFYIGGTKVGAFCGEAVVFRKGKTPPQFVTVQKQQGALLAKGRLLGVQFDTLFTDGLYFEISKNAIDRAEDLKALLREKGYRFFLESPTNQQFVILPNERLDAISEKVRFSYWEKFDDHHTVVRFATGWATTLSDLNRLREVL